MVDDPTPLPGGQGFVFQANTAGDRPELTALKLLGEADEVTEQCLRARWTLVQETPHSSLALPTEIFRGPGLFSGPEQPSDEDSDLLYAAIQWVPGTSLRAAAPLTPSAVASMAQDLSQALRHLHEECGLVHRDVHPGNVIIGPDGRATLIDLGAARPDDDTSTTTVAGVLGFIPPERTHSPGDRRSDAWALGMVVVYAILGHPAGGQLAARLAHELDRTLPPKSDRRRVASLIERMIATDPALRPADLVRWADELAEALQPAVRRRWVAPVLIATVVAAVLALGATALVHPNGDGRSPATPTTLGAQGKPGTPTLPCDLAIGTADAGLSEVDAAKVRDAAPALQTAVGDGCGLEPASLFGDAVYQRVAKKDEERVIIVSPTDTVALTPAEWASYREIAGRQRAENAITFGGYPTAVTPPSGDVGTNIELSRGGLLLGRRDDTQSFWMPAPVLALWRARGGLESDLGFPMTNPFVVPEGLRQDFEGGHLELSAEAAIPLASIDPGMLVVHLDDDPRAMLHGIHLEGRLLRQPTGTAWFVDERGRRRWIADGATYACLGGDGAIAANDLAGAAVATLPLGPPARCDER